MCGICGILHKNKKYSIKAIERMNSIQKHRGPDSNGIYNDEYIMMGHTRLKIIDVLSRSDQPMTIDNLSIVFNGEIYNWIELKKDLTKKGAIFSTESDTEVILLMYKEYGKKCLEYFRGMYAFAIWDNDKKELFCARDHFGVKPFYYINTKNLFAFSSEIKTLLPFIDSEPNYNVIGQYLTTGLYSFENETFFKHVYSLLPSCYMVINKNGDVQQTKYWNLEEQVKFSQGDEDKAEDEYLSVLHDYVNICLRSDVPVGINISGGLDSSFLMGLIDSCTKEKLSAYTYTCGGSEYDETSYAQKIIDKYSLKWNIVDFSESEFLPYCYKMQWYQDEPFGGLPTLAHSKIFELANMQGIKVILCGAGMDEQWGGYDYYNTENINVQKASVIQGTSGAIVDSVLDPDFKKTIQKTTYPSYFKDPIDNLKYRDLFYSKFPRALRFFDRISMSNSVELRVPFIDYKVIESSFKMPSCFLIQNNVNKFLLRKMASRMLPDSISHIPKRPLQTPQREWLKKSKWVRNIIFSKSFSDRGLFIDDEISKVYNDYANGKFDNSFFLWQWINMEIWFNVFMDTTTSKKELFL